MEQQQHEGQAAPGGKPAQPRARAPQPEHPIARHRDEQRGGRQGGDHVHQVAAPERGAEAEQAKERRQRHEQPPGVGAQRRQQLRRAGERPARLEPADAKRQQQRSQADRGHAVAELQRQQLPRAPGGGLERKPRRQRGKGQLAVAGQHVAGVGDHVAQHRPERVVGRVPGGQGGHHRREPRGEEQRRAGLSAQGQREAGAQHEGQPELLAVEERDAAAGTRQRRPGEPPAAQPAAQEEQAKEREASAQVDPRHEERKQQQPGTPAQ